MKVVNQPGRFATTERWFIHRGLPHAITGYSATDDVFTRMAPFLGVVFVAELFGSFGDRFSGWSQAAAFVGGAAIVLGAAMVVNRWRGRSALALPDDVELPELAAFVLVPAVLPVVFGDSRFAGAAAIVAFNLVILGVGYLITSYGLVPLFGWGAGQVGRQLRQLTHLLAGSLPLLLLFSAFLFLNAEIWQVAHDFTPAYYAVVLALLFGSAMGFLVMRLPGERDSLARFESWDEVCRIADESNAPYGLDQHPGLPDPPRIDRLGRAERVNVVMLLIVSQLVQMVLVATSIGVFYVVFGLFTVRADTLLQWTTQPAGSFDPIATVGFLGDDVVLTWELLAVAGFVSAFSALQFAVSALIDQTYRVQFFTEVEADIREVLAVRALYQAEVAAAAASTGSG
ncbi:MAG: hypothetical protein OEU32_05905 [Acidimicrobiia bacterium]|nr:hypothetical protein [Acidimicrobiia bacterium]